MVSSDDEDDHVCEWVKEYALLASENNQTNRHLRANDASKKQMARNCYYYAKGRCNATLDESVCEMQCGQRGAQIQDGVLVFV